MPSDRITSPQNERVKSWVELQRDGKARRRRGEVVVEGKRLVAAALELGRVKTFLYCSRYAGDDPIIADARERGTALVELSMAAFRKIADVKTPQGVAAVCDIPRFDREALFREDALLLAASGVQEPGNLGSMIRSARAAGATGFVSLPPSADVFHPRSVRGSAGAALALPSARMTEEEFLSAAREASVRLVAAAPRGGIDFRRADWSRPVAIVIGSEAHGVSGGVSRGAELVTVPMAPGTESLNAAAAAAVLLFQAAAGAHSRPGGT